MDKKFSTKWKASSRPGKKRKYVAKAPLHIKRKFLGAMLSKELRKKYSKKTMPVRKDDKVKIMRGQFKGKIGKVTVVNVKKNFVNVENIEMIKKDGSKVFYPLHPSSVMIMELSADDKNRIKELEAKK